MTQTSSCELCEEDGGDIIYRNPAWRIVLVDDPQHPGFCRVIGNAHVKEMTDLEPAERDAMMAAVWQVEAALRDVMRPDKINLACLGNMTPHLHWHVIPRYADDAQFPGPVWILAKRTTDAATLAQRRTMLAPLRAAIVQRMTS